MLGQLHRNTVVLFVAALVVAPQPVPSERPNNGTARLPPGEILAYKIEWRLIHAGNARLAWSPKQSNGSPGWQANLSLESVGLVSRLYKVNNEYSAVLDERLCAASSLLTAREGSRHKETSVTYDSRRKKAVYHERDLKNNVEKSQEIDIPGCVHDVIGALYRLRTMRLQPGETATLPISDGKKSVSARVEVQERETIKIEDKTYKTVRYEAHLFNNVLYRRNGRLFIWLTDDERGLPVQIRIRLPIYIGTVTLQLEKEQRT